MAKDKTNLSPLIFNIFKPAGITSYDVVRHFKRNLPKPYGKIGHFGTLDPFASGVLMIGVAGAARLNNYIHDLLPKTYLAIGKLGVSTETGDLTVAPSEIDESKYLYDEISRFSLEFINEQLNKFFLGEYMQSPHKYSAAKFEGKALHKWAREGVDIKKAQVRRFVHKIDVVKYSFPYLSIRFEVSSGTYIRTLFKECAEFLGTYGTLVSLVRESIGPVSIDDALKKRNWPLENQEQSYFDNAKKSDEVLLLRNIILDIDASARYRNGIAFDYDPSLIDKSRVSEIESDFFWIRDHEKELIGMGHLVESRIVTAFNFPTIEKN